MAADISATGSGSSAVTLTHAVALGAGTADKGIYIGFLSDPGTVTPPTGWAIKQSGSVGSGGTALFGYVMTRASTSDTNVDVTTANSVESVHIWRVFATSDIANAVVPTPGTGSSDTPNPPASGALPSGDYLVDTWRVSDRSRNHSAYPINYADDQILNEARVVRAAAASRTLVGITSEDPGIYSLIGGSEWVAFTIVIPEAGGGGQTIAVGVASEVSAAQVVSAFKPVFKSVGFASEVEVALAIGAVKPIFVLVGGVSEVEMAQMVASATDRRVSVGFASEVSAAGVVLPVRRVLVGSVAEVESAFGVGVFKPVSVLVGFAFEVSLAQEIVVFQGTIFPYQPDGIDVVAFRPGVRVVAWKPKIFDVRGS